jgi:hypothetical protein
MSLAKPRLAAQGSPLPTVLNVSEVSASLDSSEAPSEANLSIDSRQLLTALLRSLRNRLAASNDEAHALLASKVEETYLKAQATSFTQTRDLSSDVVSGSEERRQRSLQVSNGLKLLAVVLVGAVAAFPPE